MVVQGGRVRVAMAGAGIMCRAGLLLLVLGCWVPSVAPQATTTGAKKPTVTPEAKQASMVDLLSRSQTRVVTLDDRTFAYHAVEKPRPYNVVALFTATASKYQCLKCKEVEAEFQLVAESYLKQLNGKTQDATVFFARIDFDSSPNVFKSYDFKGVPVIIHIPPYSTDKAYSVDARDRFGMHGVVDAESIAKFVQNRAGVEISIYRSPYGAILLMLFMLTLLALSARYLLDLLPFLLRKIQNKWLWMAASGVLYTCSISGLVFDIIRNPPPFYMDPRSGQIMFFHPQSGQQFVVEGFIIGGLNLLAALAALLLVDSATTSRIKDERSRSYWLVSCSGAFLFFFYQIFSLYRFKNRWYLRA